MADLALQQGAPVYKRIKGGFRRLIETELGEEQVCMSCGESWPTDKEFYVVTATSMAYECKACTSERRPRGGLGPKKLPSSLL
jgi:hypothetical protein